MEISRKPYILNVTLPTAGVEVSQSIVSPTDTTTVKKLQIKSKTKSDDLQYGWTPGGPYVTIFAGQTYWDEVLEAWNLTIYLVGTVNGQIAEIEVWN